MMFIRTDRLLLRPGWAEDAGALARTIASERIVRNLLRVPWPYRPYHAEAFLAREGDARYPTLLMFERGADAPLLVGGCGLTRGEDGAANLGYWIADTRWGRGYATEAAAALIATARAIGHRRIVAEHFADNPASGAVLAKLGFRRTGTARRQSQGRAGASDSVMHELDGPARPAQLQSLPLAA